MNFHQEGSKVSSWINWKKEQQEVRQTNVRAISLLYCAMSGAEYNKISICETAEEMWDKLEVKYG